MKVQGSYDSVVRGVSQQPPHKRRDGQMTEQVNMLSDPVRGLVRRHGSQFAAKLSLSLPDFSGMNVNWSAYSAYDCTLSGVDVTVLYRRTSASGPLLVVFRRDTLQFVTVVPGDVTTLSSTGIRAITSVGDYLIMSSGSTPTWTSTEHWNTTANQQRWGVWVKAGQYSKTYRIRYTTTLPGFAGTYTMTFTTPASSYPGTLDTSDIPWRLPNNDQNELYTKQVNDRVNAYNSEVTKWIGTAAAAIVPANIAGNLVLGAGGDHTWAAGAFGAHILFAPNAQITGVEVDDGGDGSSLMVFGPTVKSPAGLPQITTLYSVVKVVPNSNDPEVAYYLRAEPKGGAQYRAWAAASSYYYGEVDWREYRGTSEVMGGGSLYAAALAIPQNDSIPNLYVTRAELLGALLPMFSRSMWGGYWMNVTPLVSPYRQVGDQYSAPVPQALRHAITYLGVWQDRLVVGSLGSLAFSRPGDPLNFFRASATTLADDDPVEVESVGMDGEVLTSSVMYDKNLVIFGTRAQYVVSGRSQMTPTNIPFTQLTAFAGANFPPPITVGNSVYYASGKLTGGTALHRLQVSQLADTPEGFSITQQLDSYLGGSPLEMTATNTPSALFLRSEHSPYGLHVYYYLDVPGGGERVLESWSRWEWSDGMGKIIGMSPYKNDLMVFTVVQNSQGYFVTAHYFPLSGDVSPYPYLDSLCSNNARSAGTALITSSMTSDVFAAIHYGDPAHKFVGEAAPATSLLADYGGANVAWGFSYPAFVTPTNPQIRDRDGQVVPARLTLNRLTLHLQNTGGLDVSVTGRGGGVLSRVYDGWTIGRTSAVIGTQPVASGTLTCPAGFNTQDGSYTIQALNWLPLNITGIDWTGQLFKNTRSI